MEHNAANAGPQLSAEERERRNRAQLDLHADRMFHEAMEEWLNGPEPGAEAARILDEAFLSHPELAGARFCYSYDRSDNGIVEGEPVWRPEAQRPLDPKPVLDTLTHVAWHLQQAQGWSSMTNGLAFPSPEGAIGIARAWGLDSSVAMMEARSLRAELGKPAASSTPSKRM